MKEAFHHDLTFIRLAQRRLTNSVPLIGPTRMKNRNSSIAEVKCCKFIAFIISPGIELVTRRLVGLSWTVKLYVGINGSSTRKVRY